MIEIFCFSKKVKEDKKGIDDTMLYYDDELFNLRKRFFKENKE